MLYHALNTPVLEAVPASAKNILDLGCGTGNLAAVLKERGAKEIVGITFSESEAALAAQKLDRVLVEDLDTFLPPANFGAFDAVICSHVLEHLREPERLLRVIRDQIAPAGRLIVALPNLLYWKQRLRLLRGHFKYTEGGLMDSTHLRFFDWDTARQLLTRSGYTLVTAVAEGACPLPVIRRVLPLGLASWLDRTATRMFPGLFGAQFVMVAIPANERGTT